MLFKMKSVLCMLALSTAYYAQAQEKAGKAGTAQNSPAAPQAGAAQNQPAAPQTGTAQNPPAASQDGKAQSQKENQSQTGENQNRRQNKSAQSNDDKSRSSDAQDNANEDRNRTRRDVNVQRTETTETRASANKPLDTALASCLLLGNQKEVTISQFAAERAKHDKVKEFARQMVKEHNQAIAMLQRFAGPDVSKDLGASSDATRVNRSETVNRSTTTVDANRSSPEGEQRDANRNRDDASKRNSDEPNKSSRNDQVNRDPNDSPNRNRSETTVQIRSEHEALPDKMLAIEREVAQKCIAMAKHELEQSSNFDQAYVGMQISEHIGMIAKLETYKSYASPDLGKVIQESLDTAQGHLRHAKELVMEIGHDSSSAASSSSSSSRSDATKRNEGSSRSETSNRDTNVRNPANRDNDGARREAVPTKNDAPKS